MRSERGSGSMLAVIGLTLVIPLALAAMSLGSLWLAVERAGSAADLAALAGASEVSAGHDPCSLVERIVVANGATVRSCTWEGSVVVVEAEVRVSEPFGIEVPVPATARAGPTLAGLA